MSDANELCDSDEAARLYAIENLNETAENRDICLAEIRNWLRDEVPWINARQEETYLWPFLRACKFNVDKTKAKIINFYVMKRERPEWFSNRDPLLTSIEELVKLGVFVPLKQTHNNQTVIIIRTAAHNPKRHQWDDVLKAGHMVLDVACQEYHRAQIYGVIAIFDMTGISFSHYRTFTPSLIKNIVHAWQNYYIRPKRLEFINAPSHINIVLSIMKTFMTPKMRGRIAVHFGGVESAQNIVNKEILPTEYGGQSGESVDTLGEFWFDKLVKYRQWFREDEEFKAQNV